MQTNTSLYKTRSQMENINQWQSTLETMQNDTCCTAAMESDSNDAGVHPFNDPNCLKECTLNTASDTKCMLRSKSKDACNDLSGDNVKEKSVRVTQSKHVKNKNAILKKMRYDRNETYQQSLKNASKNKYIAFKDQIKEKRQLKYKLYDIYIMKRRKRV